MASDSTGGHRCSSVRDDAAGGLIARVAMARCLAAPFRVAEDGEAEQQRGRE
jgi:hypothetical protein